MTNPTSTPSSFRRRKHRRKRRRVLGSLPTSETIRKLLKSSYDRNSIFLFFFDFFDFLFIEFIQHMMDIVYYIYSLADWSNRA